MPESVRIRVAPASRAAKGRYCWCTASTPAGSLSPFRSLPPPGRTFRKERERRAITMPDSDRRASANAISNAMTKLHREHYGRGPDTVRTVVGNDHAIAFLEDMYTPSERTLIEAGETEAVTQSRLAFQRALRETFVEVVGGATGPEVRAVLSQTHIDPDISCEIFVLEPNGTEPAPQAVG